MPPRALWASVVIDGLIIGELLTPIHGASYTTFESCSSSDASIGGVSRRWKERRAVASRGSLRISRGKCRRHGVRVSGFPWPYRSPAWRKQSRRYRIRGAETRCRKRTEHEPKRTSQAYAYPQHKSEDSIPPNHRHVWLCTAQEGHHATSLLAVARGPGTIRETTRSSDLRPPRPPPRFRLLVGSIRELVARPLGRMRIHFDHVYVSSPQGRVGGWSGQFPLSNGACGFPGTPLADCIHQMASFALAGHPL